MFSPELRKRYINAAQIQEFDRYKSDEYIDKEDQELDSSRIRYYIENEMYYKGRHWSWTRDPAEPLHVVNYCRLVVDKHARTLAGKSWTLSLPPELNDFQEYIEELFTLNSKDEFSLELVKMGGMTGDAFIHVGLAIHPQYEMPYVKFTIVPSKYMHPIVTKNIGFGHQIVGYKIIYAELDESGTPIKHEIIYTKDVISYRINKKPVKTVANTYGIIPFIFIRNSIIPGEMHGRSDLDDVVMLNKTINENLTKIQDAIRYYGNPYLFIYGARVNQIQQMAGRVMSIVSKDARAEFLEIKNNLELMMQGLRTNKEHLHEVGNVPEASTGGKTPAISNTSSAALQTLFKPIIEVMDEKRINYSAGLIALILPALHFKYILSRQKRQYSSALMTPNETEFVKELEKVSDPAFVKLFDEKKDILYKLSNSEVIWKEPFAVDRLRFVQELPMLHSVGLLVDSVKEKALKSYGVENPTAELLKVKAEMEEQRRIPEINKSDKGAMDSILKSDLTTPTLP